MAHQDDLHNETNNSVPEDDHLRKMFLGGLTPNTNEEMVRQFYYQFGEIDDVVIMRDPATKRSRGFGFVTFKTTTSVDNAQAARPHVVDGRTIDSKRALPRTDSVRNDDNNSVRKVFVGGLKDYHDEECLREYFQQFGKVVSVNILVDKITGRKRGFAFVEFDDYDTVDKVVLRKTHTIKYMLVDVKKSNYKQVQAKRLALQQQTGAAATDPNTAAHGSYPPPGYPPGSYTYPPPQTAYAGWSYPQPTAPYTQQQTQSYAGYAAPAQNAAAPNWNGYAAPGWGQQSAYNAPAAANGWSGTPTATQNSYSAPPAANSWTATPPPPNGTQSFGNYQQSYNGGPQKSSNLQGNRMNPYSVV